MSKHSSERTSRKINYLNFLSRAKTPWLAAVMHPIIQIAAGLIVLVAIAKALISDLTLFSSIDYTFLFLVLVDLYLLDRIFLKKPNVRQHGWAGFFLFTAVLVYSWDLAFGFRKAWKIDLYQTQAGLNYLAILFGALLIPLVRNLLRQLAHHFYRAYDRVSVALSQDFDTASSQNARLEKTRESSWKKNHQRVNQIPVIGRILGWFYREGLGYSIAIVVVVLFGFLLRVYQLDLLEPAGDEYRHLLAAKHYAYSGYYDYTFSHFTTYIVILIQKLTGALSLFWLRLPFVLMGTISIALFYVVGKNIHKSVGLMAAYLFAFLPLAIGMARYIRSYEMLIFVSLLSAFLLITPWIKNITTRFLVVIAGLKILGELNHGPRFDSIILFILIFCGIWFGVSQVKYFFSTEKHRFTATFTLLVLTLAVGLFAIPLISEYDFMPLPEWQYLFVINVEQSLTLWYPSFVPATAVVLLALVPTLLMLRKRTWASTLFVVVFVFAFYIFLFDAGRRFQARYIYNVFPYLLILFSMGLRGSYLLIKRLLRGHASKSYLVLSIIIFLIIFSPINAIRGTVNETNGEFDTKTEIPHYDAGKLVDFMNQQSIEPTKVLISQPWVMDYYFDERFLNADEVEQYVHFPWVYEFKDRTAIYSISWIGSDETAAEATELIETHGLTHVILHQKIDPENPDRNAFDTLRRMPMLELQHILDEDKEFGYYVYSVVN